MKTWLKIISAVVILLLPEAVYAHPHASIDVKVQINFKNEKVISLREIWLFDEYYTAFALDDIVKTKGNLAENRDVNALFKQNIKNLVPYHYYTKLEMGGAQLDFGEVTTVMTRLIGNRVEMTFIAPLLKPVSLEHSSMRYAIFDPSYYIEMLHAESKDAIVLNASPQTCSYKLEKPNPDPDKVALAYTLDQTQTGGDNLGVNFAEWVTVTCP